MRKIYDIRFKRYSFLLLFMLLAHGLCSQPVPSLDEKIPFLVTFSYGAEKSWGDDDFVQVFFFVIPQGYKNPVFIRIFDPEVGGMNDEKKTEFNSKTKFSLFGGKGAYSNPDAIKQDPVGNYRSGILLATEMFGSDPKYDNSWYSFGPFNPSEGEFDKNLNGFVIKIIIEGMEGDDGNLYRMFMSSSKSENLAVEGGNAFTYEYSLRLSDKKGSVSHMYPFVTPNVVSVKLNVFDFDNDGIIRIVSVGKKGDIAGVSGDNTWLETVHKIVKEEHNTSLDVQLIKQKESRDNNLVIYLTNQYGELLPFYTVPIGGVPKFKYKIGVKVGN